MGEEKSFWEEAGFKLIKIYPVREVLKEIRRIAKYRGCLSKRSNYNMVYIKRPREGPEDIPMYMKLGTDQMGVRLRLEGKYIKGEITFTFEPGYEEIDRKKVASTLYSLLITLREAK